MTSRPFNPPWKPCESHGIYSKEAAQVPFLLLRIAASFWILILSFFFSAGNSALASWTEEEVCNWIARDFPQYSPAFKLNNINGELLSAITENELNRMGIVSLGHQKAIIAAISRLLYTLNFPIMQPTIHLDRTLSASFLQTISLPFSSPQNTLPSSASTPSLRSPSNISPPISRSASALSDGAHRHLSISVIIFHRRVQSINATYRVGVLIEVDPLDPLILTSDQRSSSSSLDSDGSGSGQNSVSRGYPSNLDPNLTKSFVERMVIHWPGESDFGQMITSPPFEGKTTREIRPGSEIVVDVHFDKNRYRKKISNIRHKITLTDGFSRTPVSLRPKGAYKD